MLKESTTEDFEQRQRTLKELEILKSKEVDFQRQKDVSYKEHRILLENLAQKEELLNKKLLEIESLENKLKTERKDIAYTTTYEHLQSERLLFDEKLRSQQQTSYEYKLLRQEFEEEKLAIEHFWRKELDQITQNHSEILRSKEAAWKKEREDILISTLREIEFLKANHQRDIASSLYSYNTTNNQGIDFQRAFNELHNNISTIKNQNNTFIPKKSEDHTSDLLETIEELRISYQEKLLLETKKFQIREQEYSLQIQTLKNVIIDLEIQNEKLQRFNIEKPLSLGKAMIKDSVSQLYQGTVLP
jgi:hypothetical protein